MRTFLESVQLMRVEDNNLTVNKEVFKILQDVLLDCMARGPDLMSGEYSNPQLLKNKVLNNKNKSLHVICFPKSGSSYLNILLKKLTEYPYLYLHETQGGRENYLYLPHMILAKLTNHVTKRHVWANSPDLNLMNLFSIKPIILTRNIFDTIVSYFDHLHKPYVKEGGNDRGNTMAFLLYVEDSFYELPQEEKLNYIIDYAASWYIRFYATWYAKASEGLENLWIDYKELVGEPNDTLKKICQYYELDKSNQEIDAVVSEVAKSKKETSSDGLNVIGFNSGVAGRGRQMLTTKQIDRITNMTCLYSKVDFSRILDD